MVITRLIIAVVVVLCTQVSVAADFFDKSGSLRKIAANDPIAASDTVGGFAFYQGDGDWKFELGKSTMTTGGTNTTSVPMATVVTNQYVNGQLFQRLVVVATIGSAGGSSFSGSPCSQDHAILRNKQHGREDHCMTIDPTTVRVGTKDVTFLSIRITNSNGGNYYAQNLMVNTNLLGNRDTGVGDWSESGLSLAPHRRALLEHLTIWGEKFLDLSQVAFGYSQPQDSYAMLPSIRTVLPAIVDYPIDKYSVQFHSWLADSKHRPSPKAMAYASRSNSTTVFSYNFSAVSHEQAESKAMDDCIKRRKPTDTECKLVPTGNL